MNPATPGTKAHRTIARRQVLERLGRELRDEPNFVYSDEYYAAIDNAEEALDRIDLDYADKEGIHA